jgi:DNA-binding CsgD family transcriptional regulator/tetratricopeptide (TPR) repeat protein
MVLLEREWVLEFLDERLAQAAAGRGSVVFLSGEAGAGKSAIIQAFAERVAGQARLLSGACDSISIPGHLWPLRDLATSASPALRESIRREATRDALFHATLNEFSTYSGATVMVIEDAHWADDATLDLLRFLGRRVPATRGLVIVTYRDDDSSRLQRLRLLLGDLATVPELHRLALPALSRDAVAQLARGRTIDPAALFDRTSGNAFFVTELLATNEAMPERIGDAIEARYVHLSESARQMLELAAVVGEAVELSTLRALIGESESALFETLASGALRLDGHIVRFRHALVRDAVLASLSSMQRVNLHAQVFDTFERNGIAADPASMAHLAEEAGRFSAVPAYAKAAAELAAEHRSYREAASQYQRALTYSADLTLAERSDLLGHLAEVTFYCGAGETDPGILRELVQSYRSRGDRRQLANHLLWLAWVLIDDGAYTEAQSAADEAVGIAATLDDPALHASALATVASLIQIKGRTTESLEIAAAALDLAEQGAEPRIAIQIRSSIGSRLLVSDEASGAEILRESIENARSHRFDIEVVSGMADLGFHWFATFQLDRAECTLTEAADYAAERDLDCWRRWVLVGLSQVAFARGDWARATNVAGSAIQVQSGCFLNRFFGYLTIARVRARRGDPEVDAAIDAARGFCIEEPNPHRACLLAIARAEAAWLAGDSSRALRETADALPIASKFGLSWFAGELAHYHRAAGGALPAAFDPPGPYRYEVSGDWKTAANEWRRLGAPYETARALAMTEDEQALRHALAGFDKLGAQPMSTSVTRRLRELGVSSIPRGPRPSTKANPFGLTAREAEILEQIGEGWTNSEIAARLFLSQRTVEHHVSSLLGKLGAHSRREATRLARAPIPTRSERTPVLVK